MQVNMTIQNMFCIVGSVQAHDKGFENHCWRQSSLLITKKELIKKKKKKKGIYI